MQKQIKKILKDLGKAFNTGVSYMLPTVVIGGVFLALALATGSATDKGMVVTNDFFKNIQAIGSAGFAMMIPVLAGYISYSIAGKPGIAPAMIAGYLANNPIGANHVQTGFLGAMIVGVVAGYIVRWMKKWKVNDTIRSIMPVLIIPIISSAIVCLLYIYVLANPLGYVMKWLTDMLGSLQGGSALVLGLVIGAMTAFDMGGPVNKTASAFTMALMAQGLYGPNGAFRIAVAIPPLGIALSTFISRKKYTPEERKLGVSSAFMGVIGITEGAIPFAVKSLKTVLPSIMIGTAVGAGLGMLHGVECMVPHGGLIVLAAVNGKVWYVVDMMIGVVVTAIMLHLLRRNVEE